MVWAAPRRRRLITLGLLFGLVVIAAVLSGTHGTRPAAGTRYAGNVVVQAASGQVIAHLPVGFAISERGGRVVGLTLPLGPPRACRRALPGAVTLAPVDARIVAPDIFRLRTTILAGARRGDRRARIGTLEMSGAFGSFGRVSGALATRYVDPGLAGCGARGGFTARSTG